MKRAISTIVNFCIMVGLVLFAYVSVFTDIPAQTSNEIKQKVEESKYEYIDYSSDFYINELTINMSTFYYDKLTEDQKKIYDAIANGVKNFRNEFSVKDYSPEDKDVFASETARAIEAFINDHPEVFYLRSEYSTYIVTGFRENIGYVKVNYTEETIEDVYAKYEIIKEKIDSYVSEVSHLETEFEKELAVHDKLASIVEYSKLDELPRKYHTIEGTLIEDTGVCDSFTKSLQLIYNELGIDSIIVLGQTSGGPHAWNLVKLDNEWYHVDVTSARSIIEDTGIVNHAYFNITEERVLLTNTIDSPDVIPSATSEEYNYYNYYDLLIDGNLNKRLKEIYELDEDKNFIEFYLYGDVSDNISNILTYLRAIDKAFVKDSKMYYYNIQNAIIIPKN